MGYTAFRFIGTGILAAAVGYLAVRAYLPLLRYCIEALATAAGY